MFLISCFPHAYQYSIQQNHNLFHNCTFIPTPFKHTCQAWPHTTSKGKEFTQSWSHISQHNSPSQGFSPKLKVLAQAKGFLSLRRPLLA